MTAALTCAAWLWALQIGDAQPSCYAEREWCEVAAGGARDAIEVIGSHIANHSSDELAAIGRAIEGAANGSVRCIPPTQTERMRKGEGQ